MKEVKEIEVKARVSDPKALQKKLKKLGCKFSKAVAQDDRVYNKNGKRRKGSRNGSTTLRLRQQQGKTLFTIKQTLSTELDCLEKEVLVSDLNVMEEALKMMGFLEVTRVNKTRQHAKFKDFTICLDIVEGLGSFIEVEKISDGNSQEIMKELMEFLLSLDIKEEDRVTKGYDTLMLEALKPYFVYILRTSANTLYIGQTNNLEKRLKEHMSKGKKSSKYMRSFSSFELVYKEEYNSRSEALKREYELKQLTKAEKEVLIGKI